MQAGAANRYEYFDGSLDCVNENLDAEAVHETLDKPARPHRFRYAQYRSAVSLANLALKQIAKCQGWADIRRRKLREHGARFGQGVGLCARALQVIGIDIFQRPPRPPA